VQRLLGEVEVAQQADERGEHAAGMLPIRSLDQPVRRPIIARHGCSGLRAARAVRQPAVADFAASFLSRLD
jgi:hypothetical protein